MKQWNAIRVSICALVVALAVTACGGGGGGGGSSTTSSPTTYTAAAAPGELVTYTVDTSALTYSYTITESQYGLANQSGSGSLTKVANNVYTLSGVNNGTVAILPNGMMLGSIRHNFGAGVQTVPVMGITNPISSIAGVAGTYNYVTRGCTTANSCNGNYGTIQINANDTWSFCVGANGSGCSFTGSGNLQALGNGKFAVYDSGTLVGTLFATSSGTQKVLVIDLKDGRAFPNSLGKGIVLASGQVAVNSTLTNGSWAAASSSGHWATFTASGNNIQYTSYDGSSVSSSSTATPDSPWIGLIRTSSGGNTYTSMLAGYGVYISSGPSGYLELGIKYQ